MYLSTMELSAARQPEAAGRRRLIWSISFFRVFFSERQVSTLYSSTSCSSYLAINSSFLGLDLACFFLLIYWDYVLERVSFLVAVVITWRRSSIRLFFLLMLEVLSSTLCLFLAAVLATGETVLRGWLSRRLSTLPNSLSS